MKKYGMRYSRIKYYQNDAKWHVLHYGDGGVFQRMLMSRLRVGDSRDIAYAAIQCAAVCHPSAVQFAMRGK